MTDIHDQEAQSHNDTPAETARQSRRPATVRELEAALDASTTAVWKAI